MPMELIVPAGRQEHALARRLSTISDGQERTATHERLRNMWNLFLSNVVRTAPRLHSDDVTALLAPDGRPTVIPPWDLPMDVVWGTDKPDNGRAFVILAVEDIDTTEKGVLVFFESRGPTNLPIGVARLVGTVDLVGDAPVADTEELSRGLLRLFRNGQNDFKRLVEVDQGSAKLEVTKVALQVSRQGFAPLPERAHT